MCSFPKYVQSALAEIARSEDVENAQFHNENTKGYDGELSYITIEGTNKSLQLILKTASKIEEDENYTPFFTEMYTHNNLVPYFDQLQMKNCVTQPFCLPRCYYIGKERLQEVLVLENMRKMGFLNYDIKYLMTPKHVEIVLKEYAKLHALGFVMKHTQARAFEEMSVELGDNVQYWFTKGKLLDVCKTLCNIAKGYIDEEFERKVYAAFCETIEDFMVGYDWKRDAYATITHSGCWINNMMFKYKDSKVVGVTFLDFQLARVASPIFDLSFYLCTCTGKTTWKKMDHYLDVYYDSLSTQIAEMGCDPNKLFPKKEFLAEFKRNARYGFVLASFFLMVNQMSDVEDAVTNNFMDTFLLDVNNHANNFIYRQRLVDLIRHFCKNNYFEKSF